MVQFRKVIEHKNMKKISITNFITVAVALVFSGFVVNTVFAQDYQSQISEIDSQISAYESEIGRLQSEADTLQNKLAILTNEKNLLQVEIDKNESRKAQIEAEIVANQEKLERQKRTLNKTIAQIYANGDTSPIVMLASSKNVGEYVAAQEVRGAVRDQMNTAMDQVKKLKAELERQEKEVAAVIDQQVGQREQLRAKEAEQQQILDQTRGEEAAYASMVGNLREQRAQAQAALAASLARASYREAAPAGFVQAGAVVGFVGNTGMSTGPHLHLEARQGGSIVNPLSFVEVQPVDMPPAWVSQSYMNPDPMYMSGYHPGVDYAASTGTPIYSICSGMMYRGSSEALLGTWAYGNVAIVECGGTSIIYAHMNGW